MNVPRFLLRALGALALSLAFGHARELPLIVVSNYPLQWVVETLVGEQATVLNLTQVSEDPRNWIPDDEGLRRIEQADLLVLQGGGYEKWVGDEKLSNGFDSSQAISKSYFQTRKLDEQQQALFYLQVQGRAWLDPLHLRLQADAIRNELSKRVKGLEVGRGWNVLKEQLTEIETLFASSERLRQERILLFEPMWEWAWGRAYNWRMRTVTFPDQNERVVPPLSELTLQNVDEVVFNFPARMAVVTTRFLPKKWEKKLQRRHRIWTFKVTTGERAPPEGITYQDLMIRNFNEITSGFAK